MKYLPAPATITSIKTRFLQNKTWVALAVIVGMLLLFAIGRVLTKPKPEQAKEAVSREVTVARVSTLSLASPLSAVGTVSSVDHAELHTKKGGAVTGVYARAGAYVSAGETLATLENSTERASLASAKARVDAAQAAYSKVQKGTRDEQLAILSANLKSAQEAAKNALTGAYGAADSAVIHGTDSFMNDPRGVNPQLSFSVSDYALATKVGSERLAIESILKKYEGMSSANVTADTATLNATQTELKTILNFIDDMLQALGKTVPSTSLSSATIAGYVSATQGARAAVLAAINGLNAAQTALTVAEKNQEQGVNGAQPEDIAASKAQFDDAQAGYALAQAQYDNTLVVSPISGTLTSFTIRKGDYVAPSALVGNVENPQALEIIAYISPSDRARASVGSRVLINNEYDGRVTSISPGVDPVRKQLEMHVSLVNRAAAEELVNGSAVSVSIVGSQQVKSASILLPVSAVKLTPDGAYVFTVDENEKLVAHKIETGDVVGQSITVSKGVTSDMEIVTDARGLSEGNVVSLRK